MSLWNAIKNLARGKAEELEDSITDPIRDGRFAIQDAEKEIAQFTQSIAKSRGDLEGLRREKEEADGNVEKYTNLAKKAAQAGNKDDARSFLEKKAQADSKAATFQAQIDQINAQIDSLQKQLEAQRSRIEKAKAEQATREARYKGAQMSKKIHQASLQHADATSGLGALDKFEERVRKEEAEAKGFAAQAALDPTKQAEDLEAKYAGGTDVDAELEALMADAGK